MKTEKWLQAIKQSWIRRKASGERCGVKRGSKRSCDFCHDKFERLSSTQRFCRNCVPESGSKGAEVAHVYGIPPAAYYALWTEQEGHCALCPSILVQGKFYIDHCHKTHVVRGLLCPRCNQGMSFIDLETDWIERAQAYKSKPGIHMVTCKVLGRQYIARQKARKNSHV